MKKTFLLLTFMVLGLLGFSNNPDNPKIIHYNTAKVTSSGKKIIINNKIYTRNLFERYTHNGVSYKYEVTEDGFILSNKKIVMIVKHNFGYTFKSQKNVQFAHKMNRISWKIGLGALAAGLIINSLKL